MSIPDRVRILDAAVDAILSHSLLGVAVHFDREEFESLAPADWPQRFGSIYTFACQLCLQRTADWLKVHKCNYPVSYVFEHGHGWQAQCDATLTEIGRAKSLRSRLRYHDNRFGGKSGDYGLQAADLLAWTTTKLSILRTDIHKIAPLVASLKRLAPNGGKHTHIDSFTGDKLRTIIQYGMTTPSLHIVSAGPARRTFR